MRCDLTVPVGHSGSYARLTSEVSRIFAAGYADAAAEIARGSANAVRLVALVALAPLLPLLPLVTAFVMSRCHAPVGILPGQDHVVGRHRVRGRELACHGVSFSRRRR